MRNKEIIQFGKYYNDAEGKISAPISWLVISKTKEEMVLLSEQIIDYLPFSKDGNNDYLQSDIRKWLNEDFFNTAFSKEEQAQIIEIDNEDKVSLLSIDYYDTKYFPTFNSLKAKYSDFAKNKTKNIYGKVTTYEYGFWWLKTPNKEHSPSSEPLDPHIYVYHICNNGKLNAFMRPENKDGVRPVIKIKIRLN